MDPDPYTTPQASLIGKQSACDRKTLVAVASLHGALAYFGSFLLAGIFFGTLIMTLCPNLSRINLRVIANNAVQLTSLLLIFVVMTMKIKKYQPQLSKLIKSTFCHALRILQLHKAPSPSMFFKNAILWFPAIWLGCTACIILSNIISTIFTGKGIETQNAIQMVEQMTHPFQLVLLTISVVILAPITEEIAFRGCIYRYLESTIGKHASLIITPIFFSAIHFHLGLLLPLFFLGVCLQLLKNHTNNLYIPIAVHALFNSVAAVGMWLNFLNN